MPVDHLMGRLLDAVHDAGLDDDTLVIFTSDNGCSPEANFPLLEERGHFPSGPYRGHKADIFEGGHRVPLIVRWPGHIPAGRKTAAVACLTDIYPTLAELADQPREPRGGEDGSSLVPVFAGAAASARDTLVSHSISGRFAIRQGPWKLCLCPGSGGWSAPTDKAARAGGRPPLQLFHLTDDPGDALGRSKAVLDGQNHALGCEDLPGCRCCSLDTARLGRDNDEVSGSGILRLDGGVQPRHALAARAGDAQPIPLDRRNVLRPAVDPPDVEPGIGQKPCID
jgi:arylsulfatase A-like enzyme